MDNNKAISILESMAIDLTGALMETTVIDDSMAEVLTKRIEAIDTAQVALHQQAVIEENKPLSLNELKNRIGRPVWLVNVDPEDQWVRLDKIDNMAIYYTIFGDKDSYCARVKNYGKTFWACAFKPNE